MFTFFFSYHPLYFSGPWFLYVIHFLCFFLTWAAEAIKLIDGRPENTNHRSIKSAALHPIDSYRPPLPPIPYFIIIDAAQQQHKSRGAFCFSLPAIGQQVLRHK